MQHVAVFDRDKERRHRRLNLAQSALLLGGMVLLLSAIAFLVAGRPGVLVAAIATIWVLIAAPSMTAPVVRRLYRAQPIPPAAFPEGYRILSTLAERADLPMAPALWHVPSPLINAFAVGRRDDAAILLTDGLLRSLTLRELAGVIGHEISHIRNNDLWIMGLADVMTRMTSLLASVALFLLGISLILAAIGAPVSVPWLLIALMLVAPTLGTLMQTALSRTREFDADLDAATLTGDPAGLASALTKLDRMEGRFWEEILLPGRRIPVPSILRSHPSTKDRVDRLLSLYTPVPAVTAAHRDPVWPPSTSERKTRQPRWRRSGMWY